MVFSSCVFLFLFLPITLIGYICARTIETKNTVLLIASLIFYAWGEPIYIFLLLASITINWKCSLGISEAEEGSRIRKIWLFIAVAINVLFLVVFKYAGFICENTNYLFGSSYTVDISLPVGISFYTFQAMSYVIDVYTNKGEVQSKFRNVALYISLFPQLIAGPIVRYESISEQLSNRTVSMELFSDGVRRFIIGLGKKVVFADSFSVIADTVFDSSSQYGTLINWIGAIAYSLQILFDFSGYSDMAIGLGKMFGFNFPENFNYPYTAKSITDFWRRWHITLGVWFRDYIYIPLGGNRVSQLMHIRNLFIVWILTGLWHGANWTFVVWGLMYFLLIVFEKYTALDKKLENSMHIFSHVYTLFFVMVGWIIFRSPDISSAVEYVKTMFCPVWLAGDKSMISEIIGENIFVFLISLFLLFPVGKYLPFYNDLIHGKIRDIILIFVLLLSISSIIKGSYSPFIYFNF